MRLLKKVVCCCLVLVFLMSTSVVLATETKSLPCARCGKATVQLVYCSLVSSHEVYANQHDAYCDRYERFHFTAAKCYTCATITWIGTHRHYIVHTNPACSTQYVCPY